LSRRALSHARISTLALSPAGLLIASNRPTTGTTII
jgi:hypothetical protein